jgi:hypothetical protein
LTVLVIGSDNAVLDTVLQYVFTEIDNRITAINNVVDQTFHLATVVQAREEGENYLVVAHVGLSELLKKDWLGCQ